MSLTDTSIRKAKATNKPRKLFDERGLFLLIAPTGGKLWRFKYRFGGKEKLLALGAYPDVSLATAREHRDAARKLVAAGVDPAAQRRAERAAADSGFETIAREWFAKFSPQWVESHNQTVLSRMERDLFPYMGNSAISAITAPELLSVLQRIERRGANETARRVRQICSQVFRYAIATARAERDPSADLRGAFAPVVTVHRAAITEPQRVAGLLRVLDNYEGTAIVKAALRLAPLVFVRPGELRSAEWAEINLDRAEWIIPPWRMKMRQALIVPLSRQAVSILRELHPITGEGRFVFPSARSAERPMSDNAVLAAMRRCAIPKEEMTGHGFRAVARTILDEVLHFRVDLIEHQLGHAVKDPNGRAYNRTAFLPERVQMMRAWADYLDELKAEGEHPKAVGA
jgi:integrase